MRYVVILVIAPKLIIVFFIFFCNLVCNAGEIRDALNIYWEIKIVFCYSKDGFEQPCKNFIDRKSVV